MNCLIAFLGCMILVVISATPTPKEPPTPKPKPTKPEPATPKPKPTKAPTKPKYECGVCTGKGEDCTPDKVEKNMDYCLKLTGTCDDPKTIPAVMTPLIDFALPGARKMMADHKGELITVRKGASASMIAMSGQAFSEPGCSQFPVFVGMKNVTACMCQGDCP